MIARAGRARILALALAALAGAATLALAASPTAAPAPSGARIVTAASGRCGVCHPADRVAFEKSPHAKEDVHCTSCHGGDDTTDDKAKAHGGSFTGKVDKASVPKMCGSCHSDEKAMRPYGLPVDQLALYQTSRHGQLLAKGDKQVAVCSDCHGAHDVMPVADPVSSVYPTNVPRTCGQCHGDTTLVRQRHIKNSYADYLTSVHAHQLFDLGNMRSPTCVSCHGVHGANPPDVGEVTKVCGRCHTAERRYYIAGPHAQAMAAKNQPACVACHGGHGIEASVVTRLESNCVKCHAKGSKLERMGATMLADWQSAKNEIDRAEKLVLKADAVPMATEDYHARVEEARTYLREAMIAAHQVQPEAVSAFTLRARSVGNEIETELKHKFSINMVNKLALVVFWFYVLMTVGILRGYRNRRPRE